MEIHDLIQTAHATAVDKGWWEENDPERNIGSLLALVHSEVSEALEDYRNSSENPRLFPDWYYDDTGKPVGFASELADIIIRIADLCGGYRIDLDTALHAKLNYNKKRPVRHGNKRV